jgi:cell division protein ZapA
MASVDIEIAGRRYNVACRDGEEAHLRSVAAIVDQKAQDAAQALGSLAEARQLLFASLLLADELKELRAGGGAAASPAEDAELGESLERLAERMESLAQRLEGSPWEP